MSTRANFLILDGENKKVWIYRHSDGYPESNLSILRDMVKSSGLYSRAEDIANKLIRYQDGCDFRNEPYYPYELTDCQHGDIEYLYIIDIKERTIYTYEIISYWLDSVNDYVKYQKMIKQEVVE